MKSLLDKDFKYKKAVETDIRETFRRVRAEQEKEKQERERKVKQIVREVRTK